MTAASTSTKDRIATVEPIVRRVLAPKVLDSHHLDDLVQETLARVGSSRRDLEGEALVAYAIVAARNVWASDGAREARRGALQHRLADTRQPEQPDLLAVAGERQDALRTALASLSEAERRVLLAHEVEGVPTATLADQDRSTPGAIAARLARTRAKLRVDFLVEYRRVKLPTDQCHSVLVAFSAGDRRRQSALGAGEHMVACPTCAELVPALVERRIPVAILVPVGAISAALRAARRTIRAHPQATAVGGATVVVAVTAWAVSGGEPPPPPPPAAQPAGCPGMATADGRPVAAGSLAGVSGTTVEARSVAVQSVPANEGFWASCGQSRLWVSLVGGGESRFTVSPGVTVNFRGIVARHAAGFAATQGVDPAEGGVELDQQGFHLEVGYADLSR